MLAACSTDTLERLQDCSITGCGKKKIDYVESSTDCTVCSDCPAERGRCVDGGTACDRGFLDGDTDTANGCESSLNRLDAYWLATSGGPASSAMRINGHDLYPTLVVEAVAVDRSDPNCTDAEDLCYTLRGLQVSFGDFLFDKVSWNKGVGIVNGLDWTFALGSEVTFFAPMVVSFEVSQDAETKSVISSGKAEVSLTPYGDGTGSLRIESQVDFGGYLFDRIGLFGMLISY